MQHLLLLHGAIGAKDLFNPIVEKLNDVFEVHTLNFSGHGGREIPTRFSIEQFAADALDFLSENKIEKIDIFGYSMGGYVGLYLAKYYPEKIGKIFTLATKFEWTPEISQREIKMLNAVKIEEKLPAFASQLIKRHAPSDWKEVLKKTADMMIGLGHKNPLQIKDFSTILQKVLISIGDRDTMVTLDETINVYKNLPNAALAVWPNMSHPIEKIDVGKISGEIKSFFIEP